jgi:hypothetical protein
MSETKEHHASISVLILLLSYCRNCDSHYVEVFKGSTTNGNPIKSLCGYVPSREVVRLDKGKHLTIEFS